MVEAIKADQRMDSIVEEEGVVLEVDPSGVVASGTVLSVSTNVPADIYVIDGTGSVRAPTGSLVVSGDSRVSLFAEYRMRTTSGGVVRSNVAIREYSILQDFYPRCLSLSEVYPSPLSGESEWVEIENRCQEEVSLLGWSIDDSPETGSKKQIMDSGVTIASGSRLILSESLMNLALNNGGDAVTLFAPNGQIIDSLWYPSVKKGYSYAYLEEGYCLTTESTPGIENVCKALVKKATLKKTKAGKTSKWIAGLGTKYQAFAASTGSTVENTNVDQEFKQYEGLNDNNDESIKGADFLMIYVILLAISAVMMGWMVLVRRGDSKGRGL